jgi:hypothetical protein
MRKLDDIICGLENPLQREDAEQELVALRAQAAQGRMPRPSEKGEFQQIVEQLSRLRSDDCDPCLVVDGNGICWLIELGDFDAENDRLPNLPNNSGKDFARLLAALKGLPSWPSRGDVLDWICAAIDDPSANSLVTPEYLRTMADRLQEAEERESEGSGEEE